LCCILYPFPKLSKWKCYVSITYLRISLDVDGNVRISPYSSGTINIASPLVADSCGTEDIGSQISSMNARLRAASHLHLYYPESRRYQTAPHFGLTPSRAASFSINGKNYLAVTDNDGTTASTLSKWDPIPQKFVLVQNFTAAFSSSVTSFSIAGSHYIIRANFGYNLVKDDIWLFQSDAQYFGNGPWLSLDHDAAYNNVYRYEFCATPDLKYYLIGTGSKPRLFIYVPGLPTSTFMISLQQPFGAASSYGVRCFHIAGQTYVAIGNYSTTPGVSIHSYNTQFSFFNSPMQMLSVTADTTAIKEFIVGSNTYLITGEASPTGTGTTRVWKWLPATSRFSTTPIQLLSTTGVLDIDVFTIDEITYMTLAVGPGNSITPNYIYKWNVNLEIFDPISSINNPFVDGGILSVNSGDNGNEKYLFAGFNGAPSQIYTFI